MRYGGYQGRYKGKEYYIVPNPEASINIRDLYDMFSKMDSILVDLLNIGRICIDSEDDQTKFTCAYFFVEQYGLLGFMVEAPINADFLLNEEVTLKESNFINKNCVMRTKEYFDLFFPFAKDTEMNYTVTNGKVEIETNSDLQRMLNHTSLSNQLIYSSFYCEKIDWIIEYAKKMYKIFKKYVDLSNNSVNNYDEYKARETISDYYFSGIPYKINMYGNTPEISWQPNSLKQAIDMAFGFMLCSEKNPLRICKHCGKVFYAKNPKAEYDSSQCRNQANVYKSRNKNKAD
jgi:hypothetical protein